MSTFSCLLIGQLFLSSKHHSFLEMGPNCLYVSYFSIIFLSSDWSVMKSLFFKKRVQIGLYKSAIFSNMSTVSIFVTPISIFDYLHVFFHRPRIIFVIVVSILSYCFTFCQVRLFVCHRHFNFCHNRFTFCHSHFNFLS